MPNIAIADTWEQGDPYERYVGRWSRQVAPRFLNWLGLPARQRWVDVGCGTGALSAAILDQAAPASLIGIEPSDGFLTAAQAHLGAHASVLRGTAAAIPLADGSADVVVSGLVLNFVPDVAAALTEMTRVLSRGGCLAGYVWDYAGRMELIRYFWLAAMAIDPEAARRYEGVRFTLCAPDALLSALRQTELQTSEVTAIEVSTEFADFDDYWSPFLGGQGPAPAYAMSLDEDARSQLRERLRQSLPVRADGRIALVARAWAFRGFAT